MKFLVDNALSFRVSQLLSDAGYDAVHVTDYDLGTATDDVIFNRAREEDRVIISADTDFGTLLVQQQTSKPSFILFRWSELRQAEKQVQVIIENLPRLINDLESGAVIVIESKRIRIRSLPIYRNDEQ